jgi:hypothetical protein
MDVVLLDQAGREEPQIVIRRVKATDRLAARLRADSLDRLLAAGQSPDSDAVLTLRARELLSLRTRRAMARSLRRLYRKPERRPALVPAVPPARDQVLNARPALTQLADRLDGDEPVDVRGVALTRLLLTDGAGPLYHRMRAADLPRAAGEAIEALNPG